MISHEPQPLDIESSISDCGAIDMHAHAHFDPVGWALIAVGAAGSFLAHNFFGLCSLAIAGCGLYLTWRNGEAGRERFKAALYKEWSSKYLRNNDNKNNSIKIRHRDAGEA